MASVTWDSAFNLSPTVADRVRNTPVFIQQSRAAVQERLAVEHCLDLTDGGGQTDHGKHLRGSARAFVSDTAVAAPATVTPDDGDYATGRLQVYPTLKRLGYYSGSAWVDLIRDSSGDFEARVLKSTIATGTAPLTVASTTKVTNLNADLLDGYAEATSATANTLLLRDSAGRGKVVSPSASTDIALLSTVTGWTNVDYESAAPTLQTISLNSGEKKVVAWIRSGSGEHELRVGSTGTYNGVIIYKLSTGSVEAESFRRVNSSTRIAYTAGTAIFALVVVERE